MRGRACSPLALRAPGTLNAGRGGGSNGRVCRVATGPLGGSGFVIGSSDARGRTRRASPGSCVATHRGAVTSPAPFGGMTRTNNKPSFPSRSGQRQALLAERACAMRASPTSTEQLLWQRIRGRRLGVLFRQQVPLLGRFIADFLAPAQQLVIEVDGAYHAERGRADARRDAALERAGYRIVRVEASLVVSDIEQAMSAIRAALA
jgi:very-short-patch-repair endonuclease